MREIVPGLLGRCEIRRDRFVPQPEAREDARGAVMGACALALFAATAALTLGKLNPAVALLLAAMVWVLGAGLGYLIAWFR